jgi:PAS domain S-box-containing protein
MDSSLLTTAVGLSLALQIAAAIQALRLIKLTGRYHAWVLVVAALLFMAMRRVLVLQVLLLQAEPDGQVSFLEESVALATSALMAGGIYLIQPVFWDLKNSQKNLALSEKRYRTIFNDSRDGILVTSRAGDILAMNPAAAQLLGYQAHQISELHIWDILQDPNERRCFQRAVEANGSVNEYEMTLRGKQGREMHVEVTASVNYAHDGTVLGYQGILRDITARKQLQEALQLSEEKFSKAFNSSPIWIILSTLEDDLMVEVNEAFLDSTGFLREEVLGGTSLELGMWVDPGDRQRGVEEIRKRGMLRNLQVRRRAKQGEVLVMLWSAEIINLGGEEILLSIYLDITERQKAEAALKESEERHRLLLESLPDPIVVYDMEGRVTYVNSAFCRTFGWSDLELRGNTVPYVPRQGRQQVDEALRSIKEGQNVLSFDTRRLTKDGMTLDIQLSASCFQDARGRPAGNMVILRDVTLHNQAQQALRESEEKYRLVVENASEAIFIAQDGVVKFPNPRVISLTGYSPEELGRRPFLSMVHENDQEFVEIMHERVLSGRTVSENRAFRVISKDGQLHWVTSSGVPIVWEGRTAALSFVHDVTTQKQMERQLMHAQKMEAVGRLAGGVAHDFNNLLLIIKGYSDLAISGLDGDHYLRAQIERIREAGDKGARLIKQLLTLSHHRTQDQGAIDLNTLVDGLDDLLRPLIPENVTFGTNMAPDLGIVMGEAGQVEQVIMNLVVNALDAMPEGGRLQIETYNKEVAEDNLSRLTELSPGDYSVIVVGDTGCGMDPETISHIFEPFFTTKEAGKGTGLGLSVVYGIAQKMGGGLSVYSEPGQGTSFKVYLPHAKESAAPEITVIEQPPKAGGSETIVLVEDDEVVRTLIAEALRLSGYKVLEAGEGEEAIALLANYREPINLIISDIVMPGLSGPQLVRQLKKLHSEAKVLFISGYTESTLPNFHNSYTKASFMQKPFSMEELQDKMRGILG